MDWRWIVGGAAALGAWLVLRGKSSSPSASSKGPYAVIGDSLAVGLAAPLKTELGDVTGWGLGGSIAAMWTMQVEAVMTTGPKTVIVSLGTNDAVSPDASAKFSARIKIIVDKISAAGALPVLLASPAKKNMNAALGTTGALVLVPGPIAMQSDGVHPTPAGYAQWAKDIAEAIT